MLQPIPYLAFGDTYADARSFSADILLDRLAISELKDTGMEGERP